MASRKKRRSPVSRRLKIAAATCLSLAVALVPGVLFVQQQEKMAQAAAEAASYTPRPVARSTSTATPPAVQVVAFVGDSYSAGAGASSSVNSWTSLLSQELEWEEVNLARGGTGYSVAATDGQGACGLDYCPSYLEMIESVVQAKPAGVLVAGGRNDLRVESSEEMHDAVRSFYLRLRAALPDATIWAVNPLWDDGAPPPAIEELSVVVRESVESVGGVYVDVGQPLRGAPELVASDSVHPSDRGHAAISTAVAAELETTR
ncbi:SGNH/GDSL hydrolase family protein [Arthrobacter antioxidans]|uniref:SGNH/GDSL hydrolase family protein n=1 Tax=Arthrobacter antioxidans TaxID=2895818 RepID=UPI001FFEBFCE|nr:SGNH/GDSL hydrolase family protein [Arthrobacter antioxidans]